MAEDKKGAAQAAVDNWWSEVCLSLGPILSTDAMAKLAAQKDRLKTALAAVEK